MLLYGSRLALVRLDMAFGTIFSVDDNALTRRSAFCKQIGIRLRDVRERALFAMHARPDWQDGRAKQKGKADRNTDARAWTR